MEPSASATPSAPSPTQTSSNSEKASPSPLTSKSAQSSTSPSDSETSATVATEKAGSPLSLADFFRPTSNWSENRFDVADKAEVSGISSEVNSFYEDGAPTLELRLANNFTNLSFNVGQANSSESSEQTLVVKVLGNGKQLDVHRVPFNTIQEVSVSIKGVNAVKVRMYLDPENRATSDSVLAVISDVTAE